MIITKEIVDRCIGFVAGLKTEKAMGFYDVKGTNFPDNLLVGNENERVVMELVNAGLPIAAISEKLGLSTGTVRDRIIRQKKRVELFFEYKAFIDFMKPILELKIDFVVSNTDIATALNRKGIVYVQDLFNVCTLFPPKETYHIRRIWQGEKKTVVFGEITKRCYELINSQIIAKKQPV